MCNYQTIANEKLESRNKNKLDCLKHMGDYHSLFVSSLPVFKIAHASVTFCQGSIHEMWARMRLHIQSNKCVHIDTYIYF